MDKKNENGDFIDKRQITISMLFVTITLLTVFLIAFFMINYRITSLHKEIANNEQPVFNNTTTNTSTDSTYMLKDFEGRIGVFKNGDFQYLVDVYVFTLPENEQKLLHQGIITSSEQELLDILSSYY